MFFFRKSPAKKSLPKTGLFAGMTDFHCHILPGVDDGVQSMEEACSILAYFETLGIERVILTPHIMEDYPLNTPYCLREKFNSLRDAYHGSIALSLGAEYMLDPGFERALNEQELLPVFDNYLLMETSYLNAPVHFPDLIKQVHSKGFHIVLAHPERYAYMNEYSYEALKNSGVFFQLNILSLAGVYGMRAQQVSRILLKTNRYDFIGSDLHHSLSFRRNIERMELSKGELKRLCLLKEKCRK